MFLKDTLKEMYIPHYINFLINTALRYGFQREVIYHYTQIIKEAREHKDQGTTTEMCNDKNWI